MATAPRAFNLRHDAHTVGFSFDFEVALSDFGLLLDVPLPTVPLAGRWSFRVLRDMSSCTMTLDLGFLERGRLSPCADVDFRIDRRRPDGMFERIAAERWLSRPVPHESVEEAVYQGYAGFTVEIDDKPLVKLEEVGPDERVPGLPDQFRAYFAFKTSKSISGPTPLVLARRNPDTTHTPFPHDVRIFFSTVGPHGAELWTTSSLLSSSSQYLKRILESDLSDNVATGTKRQRQSAQRRQAETGPEKDFVDSDDETDEALVAAAELSLYDPVGESDITYRQITVKHAAYTTYRAVLRYLETGYIRFAPLSSSCRPAIANATQTRAECVVAMRQAQPDLPVPASTKSTYRLAQLLECKPLQQTCLVALIEQLTPYNAAAELFGDLSLLSTNWRKLVVAYVVKHWDAVVETATWKEAQARISRDEIPGVAPIVLDLMDARLAASS
ncbi:hypothetical protein JCM8208_004903 [Rhodotorula glutinis]